MKYASLIFLSFVLSACSSTTVKKEKGKVNLVKNLPVVAEICMQAPNKKTVEVITTERGGSTISSHSYKAVLQTKTTDNMSVFSSEIGTSATLTYVTVENILDNTTYYLFKRNFENYKINQWSDWESPDYLFKEGSQYNFLAMSNNPVDGTSNLLKINFKHLKPVKVRFQLLDKTQAQPSSDNNIIVARNSQSCL